MVAAPKGIVIDGNAGDTLQLASDARGIWTKQVDDVNLNGSGGGLTTSGASRPGSGHFVKLAVDADVTVTLLV